MLKAIEAYLALRRATGFVMLNAEFLLRSFAAFAAERRQTHVHAQTAIDWAARGPPVAQRDARLKAVCGFARHFRVEDARHKLPPVNHFGARRTRRSPHIYSAVEIDRLAKAALRLRPKGGLCPWAYATLIALLSVTGLRISEALKLTVAYVTSNGLLIRETKFRKTRLTPLHDTSAAVLKRYLARRRSFSEADPVFVDARGRRCATSRSKRSSTGWSAVQVSHGQCGAARVCTICGALLRCVRCKAVLPIEAEPARIWRRLRPTWVTSTSMRPTGTWRPQPTSCGTSPRPVRRSSPKGRQS